MSTVPALFRGLVDDAALFPPGNAPMTRAVAEYRHHHNAPYGRLVGRFLCAESRLIESEPALGHRGRIAVGLIADRGAAATARAVAALRPDAARDGAPPDGAPTDGAPTDDAAPWAKIRGRVTVEAVEIPLAPDDDLPAAVRIAARAVPGVRTFVEIPLVRGWRDAVEACAAEGIGAKLRTGGLTVRAFPTMREVGDFVAACVGAGVAFKCTAGLHRAVCHVDPRTSFHHHGFLNVLVATHAALTGADVLAAVTARDGADLAAVCHGIDDAGARPVRSAFVGFGSCSVAEPLQDLAALGLLDPDLPAHLPAGSGEHA